MSQTSSLPSSFAPAIVQAWSEGGPLKALLGHHADQAQLDATQLGMLLDTAFFASLKKEEGRPARFSVAICEPHRAAHRIDGQPFTAAALGKLSAACDWDATLLYMWRSEAEWRIWGIGVNDRPLSRSSPVESANNLLVIRVRDAGSLSLRWRHLTVFSYAHGDGTVAGSGAIPHYDIENIIAEVLPAPSPEALQFIHLSAIYRSMRAHGRGGALLVVPQTPPETIEFSYSIEAPPPRHPAFSVSPFLDARLAEAVARENRYRKGMTPRAVEDPEFRIMRDHMYRHSVENTEAECALIGRLTAIDGITVLNHAMELKGFGGKIPVRDNFGTTPLLHIDPSNGSRLSKAAKELFTGMRHNSVTMACQKSQGALGLIQSQDGPLTVVMHRDDGALWVIRPLDRLAELYER
jgi:hypothetical protein